MCLQLFVGACGSQLFRDEEHVAPNCSVVRTMWLSIVLWRGACGS